VKLAPAGITARELIDEYCGGMMDGHNFAALFCPEGASGGISARVHVPTSPLDFGTLEKHGCLIGSRGDRGLFPTRTTIKGRRAPNLMRFFEDESCGPVPRPCRSGTQKAPHC